MGWSASTDLEIVYCMKDGFVDGEVIATNGGFRLL